MMLVPLVILAALSVLLGFIGTPAWPWFQDFLSGGEELSSRAGSLFEPGTLRVMGLSSAIVLVGIGVGWWLYGRRPTTRADEPDVLERLQPDVFALLRRKYFVDEIYEATIIRFNAWWAKACDWLDRKVWSGVVLVVALVTLALGWLDRLVDEYVVNLGFDEACRRLTGSGQRMSDLQCGRVQRYLRVLGVALTVLVLVLAWGCRAS